MECARCGAEVSDGTKLCQECSKFFTTPDADRVDAALSPSVPKNEKEPKHRKRTGKNDPTITGLLNSLADGSFRRASSPPKNLALIAIAVIAIIAAAGAAGYWYSSHGRPRMPLSTDRGIKKSVEKPVRPFIIEKTPVINTAAPRSTVSGPVKKKVRKARRTMSATQRTASREDMSSPANYAVNPTPEERKKPPGDDGGFWLNETPPGPYVTPPSRDPRESGF